MTPASLLAHLNQHNISLDSASIEKLSGGKDNITYRARLSDGRAVVIQCMRSIHGEAHARFLEEAIDFVVQNDSTLGFVATPEGIARFVAGEDCFIQIMQAVDGKNASEDDVNADFILEIAKRLGRLHRVSASFPSEKYREMNYHRDRLTEFRTLAETFVEQSENPELLGLLGEYTSRMERLAPCPGLRVGLIHGDPVYKNFLLDHDKNIVAWIDYDMVSVTTQLWDLADMYRGYTKVPTFSRADADALLDAYESEHPLTDAEREALPDYIRMMTLDTGYRYILALDPTSGFYNAIGDSLQKAHRCIRDYDRVGEWFGV